MSIVAKNRTHKVIRNFEIFFMDEGKLIHISQSVHFENVIDQSEGLLASSFSTEEEAYDAILNSEELDSTELFVLPVTQRIIITE